jgi:hypothetical protein
MLVSFGWADVQAPSDAEHRKTSWPQRSPRAGAVALNADSEIPARNGVVFPMLKSLGTTRVQSSGVAASCLVNRGHPWEGDGGVREPRRSGSCLWWQLEPYADGQEDLDAEKTGACCRDAPKCGNDSDHQCSFSQGRVLLPSCLLPNLRRKCIRRQNFNSSAWCANSHNGAQYPQTSDHPRQPGGGNPHSK